MRDILAKLAFNQKFISFVSKQHPYTISRYAKEMNTPHTVGDNNRKKYDFEAARSILREAVSSNYKIIKPIQVFFNFKGGTGKTSLTHQISVHLSLLGFKILAIDCDPQAHLSSSFGFNEYSEDMTLFDVLINKMSIEKAIKPIYPGLDCVPSNLSMTKIELPLAQVPNGEKLLRRTLEPLKGSYDFILLDTNPTISKLNYNTTFSADKLNIVCETQPYSLAGLRMLIAELEEFENHMDIKIDYSIIANKYEAKTVTSQEALGILRHDYKDIVMNSLMRKCEDINISAKKKLPIHFFASLKSMAMEDVTDLVNEIICKSSDLTYIKEKHSKKLH